MKCKNGFCVKDKFLNKCPIITLNPFFCMNKLISKYIINRKEPK